MSDKSNKVKGLTLLDKIYYIFGGAVAASWFLMVFGINASYFAPFVILWIPVAVLALTCALISDIKKKTRWKFAKMLLVVLAILLGIFLFFIKFSLSF